MKKEPSAELTQRFINGLKEYGLTLDDINKWKYCGSDDTDCGRSYFLTVFKNCYFPEKEYQCVCGVKIINNHYITDGNDSILIIGSECKDHFVPIDRRGKTCELCEVPHKNRIVNRCNNCRKGLCDLCSIDIDPKYKKCYKCKFSF